MKSEGVRIGYGIIQDAFECIVHHATFGTKLQGKWLSPKTFIDAIVLQYFSDNHAKAIDPQKFNTTMAKSKKRGATMHCFDGTNKTNVWNVS